jgi:hypothetical protein
MPGGGQLKVGGTNPGAGRPRELVRLKALAMTLEQLDWLEQVRDGHILEHHVTMFGQVVMAPASLRDKLRAAEGIERLSHAAHPDAKGTKGGGRLEVVWADAIEPREAKRA